MTLPGVSNTVLDGGLGVSAPASSVPHILGVFESGPSNTPTRIANQRQLRETFGSVGPGVDCAGLVLGGAGGPVVITRLTASVAAGFSAPDAAPASTYETTEGGGADNEVDFAVATSAPKNDYDLVITIVLGGARGTATFTYSLDGGLTTSPVLVTGTAVALGTSGVTAAFQAGSTAPFVAAVVYEIECKAAHPNATNIATAITAAEASLLQWDFFVLAGNAHDGDDGALLAAGLATGMAGFLSSFDRPFRAMMNAGRDAAAQILVDYAAFTDLRVAVLHGTWYGPAPSPITGRAFAKHPTVHAAALRAAGNVISTDLAQTFGAASIGPLPGVISISHNEFLAEAGLDDAKIGTLRTYPNMIGFFLTNVWLRSGVGSDFEFWQHGRIMDQACRIVSEQHSQLISSMVSVKADGSGSLTEAAAVAIETKVQRALDSGIGSALRGVGPLTISGEIGHVSDIAYSVDRDNNVLSTKTLIATVSIVPRGYLKRLEATLAYRLQV